MTRTPTILLVEDESIIALNEAQILRNAGYAVIIVHDGEKAVEVALSHERIDLILMDIDLGPGTDGTDAARRILAQRTIPVVFLSSHTESTIVERTEAVGSYGYVVKNSGETVLLASIKMALRLFEANRTIDQQNAELRESHDHIAYRNRLFETIIKHDRCAIAILDTNLIFRYVSDRFRADYRVTDDQVIGRHHYDVFPEIPEKWREVHRRALAGEILRSDDDVFVRPDGTVDYTSWECRPWHAADGTIAGIILYTEVITARKTVEQELQRSREYLATTFDSIGDAVITTDETGRVVRINRVGASLTGWPHDEAVGRELHEVFRIVNAYTRVTVENPVARVLETGNVVGLANHTVLISRDGAEYQIADSAAPILDESGDLYGVVLVFRDVTAEYGANRSLAESERFLSAVLESVQDGMSVLNPDLTVRYTNNVMKRWYADRSPLVGRKCYHVYHNSDRICDPCPTIRCMGSGRTESVVVPGAAGTDVEWLELFSYPMVDEESGIVTGIVEFVRDITQRRRAEQKMLTSERFFEHARDMLCIAGFDGYFKVMNPAWERILGWSRDELLSKPWIDFVHPDDIDSTAEVGRDLSSGREVYRFRNRYRCSDGRYKWLAWNSFPYPDDEVMYGVARDVTAEIENEQALNALVREKSVLMNELQHRVKNSLNIVSSMIGIEMDKLHDDAVRRVFSDARSRIYTMSLMYDRLRDSDGHSAVEIGAFIRDVADSVLGGDASPRRLSLTAELAEAHLDTRQAIPVALIVNELLTNVVKYAYPDDAHGNVRVGFTSHDATCRLTVADDGVGLPADFSFEAATSTGVTLIKALAEQLGGSVTVVSDAGVSVLVEFPCPRSNSSR